MITLEQKVICIVLICVEKLEFFCWQTKSVKTLKKNDEVVFTHGRSVNCDVSCRNDLALQANIGRSGV